MILYGVLIYSAPYAFSIPIWDLWVVYNNNPKDPHVPICGIYFGQEGKYNAFVNGQFDEKGLYSASNDTVYIKINESTYPERVGIKFFITCSIEANAIIHITNASIVFWKFITTDTLVLEAGKVEVNSIPWGKVKRLFFKGI